jgi:CelD/BcsL family acetyltransferase involved in cellulose biosynthesis
MNFYATREFLDAAAVVHFKGRRTRIEDVRIGGELFRFLVVDGERIVTQLPFLDYHQPLGAEDVQASGLREGRCAENVVRGVIEAADWTPAAFPGLTVAPFVDWTLFPSYDDYKACLLRRHRGLVRDRERRGRKLAAAHGDLVFTMNDRHDDVFDAARKWKSRQLRESGMDDIFAAPTTAAFLDELRRKGGLVSSTLRASGRLLAIWIGFVHDGVWSGWIFTYDPEFKKYSVGHQLLNRILEESHRLGHNKFDFSIGDESYKFVYASHCYLLGPVGRQHLPQRLMVSAKWFLKTRNPIAFHMVRNVKNEILAMKSVIERKMIARRAL